MVKVLHFVLTLKVVEWLFRFENTYAQGVNNGIRIVIVRPLFIKPNIRHKSNTSINYSLFLLKIHHMTLSHLHLLTNHLPIIGFAFGFLLLAWALLKKSEDITMAAYAVLVISGVGGVVTFFTGEEAEEAVEHLPGISHDLIHEHEEAGELAYFIILAVTILSVIALVLNKRKNKWRSAVNRLALLLALAGTLASVHAGYHGGLIRHSPQTATNSTSEHDDQEHEGEDH